MTKQEAIEAMQRGEKITHRHFYPHKWIMMKEIQAVSRCFFDDGSQFNFITFWMERRDEDWNDGYSIFKDSNPNQ